MVNGCCRTSAVCTSAIESVEFRVKFLYSVGDLDSVPLKQYAAAIRGGNQQPTPHGLFPCFRSGIDFLTMLKTGCLFRRLESFGLAIFGHIRKLSITARIVVFPRTLTCDFSTLAVSA